jgi:hypothetical protein
VNEEEEHKKKNTFSLVGSTFACNCMCPPLSKPNLEGKLEKYF